MTPTEAKLSDNIASLLGRRHCILCGRGTTALWLALRAIAHRDGLGEVIVPDILCTTALDGLLLAGFTPIFADVVPDRFTLSPDSVARLITSQTRAILVVHIFGYLVQMDEIRHVAGSIPIIE